MSSRNTKSNRSTRNTSTRSTGRDPNRTVFDPTDYDRGVYKVERKLKRIGMGIRRGDTRHGDYSNVVLWKPKDARGDSRRFTLTLSEARSLQAFLNRELQVRAR
jgi:hypothetical protein